MAKHILNTQYPSITNKKKKRAKVTIKTLFLKMLQDDQINPRGAFWVSSSCCQWLWVWSF